MREILIVCALLAVAISCWKAGTVLFDRLHDGVNATRLDRVLNSLNEETPARDVEKNQSRGDYRYVGCWGEPGGPFFPGVAESKWPAIRQRKQYWTLDGTTNAIESNHHKQLINRAWQYARRYNEELERRAKTPAD